MPAQFSKLLPFLKKYGWDIVCGGLLYFFFIYLISNLSLFPAVHGDLFQYIGDGRAYFSGKLPGSMQIPPLHPILIQILRHCLFFTNFPEFKAAILINIFSTAGYLTLIWAIARKHIGKPTTAFLLLTLMAHSRTLLGAAGTTPEPLLLFLILLAIFLWTQTRFKNLAFIVAALSTMAKTEGILIMAVFTIEIFSKAFKFPKKYWGVWLGSSFVIFLTFLTTINNFRNGIPYTNYYLEELATRTHFFDFRFFYNLPHQLFFPASIHHGPFRIFEWSVIVTLLTLGAMTYAHRKIKPIFYSLLFVWGYLIVHGFFPAHEDRYYFPVIPVLFLGFFSWITQLFKLSGQKIAGTVLLLGFSFLLCCVYIFHPNIAEKSMGLIEHRSGYIRVAQWLSKQSFREKNIVIFAVEPIFIYSQIENGGFFNPNHNSATYIRDENGQYLTLKSAGAHFTFIEFDQIPTFECDSFSCVIQRFQAETDDFYVIYNYDNFVITDLEFFHNKKDIALTHNPLDKHCFVEMAAFEYDYRIMKYDREACKYLLESR